MKGTKMLLGCALLAASLAVGHAQAQTTLRMTWYSDGNEGEVMSDLLRRFEEQNKDIKVVLDQVPFKAINENLPVQLAAGQGPDLARVADLGGVARYTLDLRPHLKDPAYFETNFGPFLEWMRAAGRHDLDPGLHDPAHPDRPVRQQDPVRAGRRRDAGREGDLGGLGQGREGRRRRSRRRSRSPSTARAIASSAWRSRRAPRCSTTRANPPSSTTASSRAAQLVYDWHKNGVMSKELWGSVAGTAYRGANDEFKNAQVVMYVSGSWQIGQFDKTIGDAFDWVAVPTPCGPATCSGMPGGAALVAIKTTQHPKEVARLVEYLASEKVAEEFYERSLFVPGHLGLAKQGLDYKDASPQAKAALKVFSEGVSQLSPVANKLQGYVNNRVIFNAVISRLGQAIAGEATLDEAYKRITADVEQQIAERNKK